MVIKTVTIAQALKERKRLEARLHQYQTLVREQNCIIEGSRRVVDVLDMMKKCEALEEKIFKVRAAVARANLAVSDRLVELDVLKKRQRFVAQIPCDESLIDRMGDATLVRKEAVIKAMEVLSMNEAATDRINAIQDELDAFNATTRVQLED